MRGGSNVFEFRPVRLAPLSDCAEHGAARFGRNSDRAVSISPNLPCDTEPRAFHATESITETLLRQRNNALYWHAWLNGWAFGALLFSVAGLLWWPR